MYNLFLIITKTKVIHNKIKTILIVHANVHSQVCAYRGYNVQLVK